MSLPNEMRSSLRLFVEDRLGWSGVRDWLTAKRVPNHKHTYWYLLGGLLLFGMVIQMATGVLLSLYYRPGAGAYDSVREIQDSIEFGTFVRSSHVWCARTLVLVLGVHAFSTFLFRAYRRPRELTWWSGVLLFGIVVAFAFTGTLLPMDLVGVSAARIGLEVGSFIPLVGGTLADLVRGGSELNSDTVLRFYVGHVIVLPAISFLFVMIHLALVSRHGNTVPPALEADWMIKQRSIAFWPEFVRIELIVWLAFFTGLIVVSATFIPELGPKGSALTPAPAGIRPEWFFLAIFQTLRTLGRVLPGNWGVGLVLAAVSSVAIGVLALPLVADETHGSRRTQMVTIIGIAISILYVALTVWGQLASRAL